MHAAEMLLDPVEAEGLSDDQRSSARFIVTYERRWERHLPMENEFDALLVEADAVWGRELSKKVLPLKQLQQELRAYINLYLDAHCRGDSKLALVNREIFSKKRRILYDMRNEEDTFRMDFAAHLEPVENYLRCKLG